ncbi:MAG: aspartate/tyrosine/aromatic aminotransferase [Paracoccaceae bacterium]|jgi:aspartate/tyrosine/aromatic aminotransferase
MFATLSAAEPDVILSLMAAFRADPRPGKVDLGVGVYRDAAGQTPIFAAIRDAEARLLATQTTKTYVGLTGDMGFVAALGSLSFGDALAGDCAGAQSVGGSGALYVLARLIRAAAPQTVLHVPTPTWPNHRNLLGQGAGLRVEGYPYLTPDGGAVDAPGMIAALNQLGPGDAVVLHASCHNPSGLDLNHAQWAEIARSAAMHGWLPLFDAAYLGFGAGPTDDAAGMRMVMEAVPEALVAVSCSKTFGMYRDRVGAAFAMVKSASARAAVQDRLAAVNREHLSMPPDHGASAVRMVLEDDGLRASWAAELEGMRMRIDRLRRTLDADLAPLPGGQRWCGLSGGKGLFATLPLSPAQIGVLRADHAIYVVPGGRINVAGLSEAVAGRVAAALAGLV